MSWYSKVVWSEGLFLRQHHLQQNDRYLEHQIDLRTRQMSPYPWGFAEISYDRDLAQQNKFALRSASGIFQDGTPFDLPSTSPLPEPIDIPEGADQLTVYLTLPVASANMREIDMAESLHGSRYVRDVEPLIDSASQMQVEETIEVAHPRLAYDLRKSPKPGFHCLAVARIIDVRDNTFLTDDRFAPPMLACHGHPVVSGWIERVIGWVDVRLQELSRYAADASSGGGLQTFDYFMLQLLNRQINVLKHLRRSKYVHPEQLYVELLGLAGELATFTTSRLAAEYPPYDHDNLLQTFEPLLSDIQRFLSIDVGRAIRLDLTQMAANAYVAQVVDRSLFANATFVLEVSANMPLRDIQMQIPDLCKVGPKSRMREIVLSNLPGIQLVQMPTPPRQIRVLTNHVYFYLDKSSPLWPEFSAAASIGIHFSGEWPNLELDLWAILEEQR
ncbi:type VI secretion protein, family [Hartmannibacter diazotrophicus]|uniref:Type VI secretion protein, family n=1 Tax=Hartmannibacter diazotrophicus TaxID=1482074 RepID=A0A2C9D6W3_9HYPH|nr:type VI secretion system baseplate subunit TssK [Hartmannibacter diazotrophicus]SON55888.1 type VI secretion protein, family [Hartmannibacter diazotrophicus]